MAIQSQTCSNKQFMCRVLEPRAVSIQVCSEPINALSKGKIESAAIAHAGGKVDASGSAADWALPHRNEDIVLLICGR